jgi:hypothetical protein
LRLSYYTAEDILEQLNICADEFTFPMLDNAYVYLIDSKLSAYRDEKRWVLIIEIIGYSYRGGGHNGITNCLHVFGNCLPLGSGIQNENFLYITDNSDEGETFDEEFGQSLNPNVGSMLLRKEKIQVPQDIDFYSSAGVELEESSKIMIWEFLRAINSSYKERFLATEEEIRQRIPSDLPQILELNEWCHNDLANGEKPSENETFQMLAKVLETGNSAFYQPTLEPNNHWRNWPEGGTF